MRRSLRLSAPAKINLELLVGAPRADGFHDIFSIFQAVSLADTVTVSLVEGRGVAVSGDCDCPPERNIAFKAAEAYLAAIGETGTGVLIEIDKRIPIGAGLGGGSSDAAATLAGLDGLLPGRLGREGLAALAARIGSDVPFFLGTACAAVRGRGELLAALVPRSDYTLVIVDPGVSVSTKEAYALLDRSRERSAEATASEGLERGLSQAAAAYASLAPAAWPFVNDFYPVISSAYPRIREALEAVRRSGAAFAAMSGSGSAVFGVYEAREEADSAMRALEGEYSAKIAFPLARLRDSI